MPQIFTVTPASEHWAVNSRLVGVIYRFKERKAALEFARTMAERSAPATVEVRDAEGNIVEEISF